jgi:HPt (histidine-containing phosphotransfer) domain-containing protein
VPIIALTANAVSGMKEMFLKNGMNDFLAKPIEIAKLNGILDLWIPAGKKKPWSEGDKYSATAAPRRRDLEIEGVDTAAGLSMTGDSPEYYAEILASYVNDGREKIGELNEALSRGDLALYTTGIHALKSASASIGAAALAVEAKALEEAGRKQDRAFIDGMHGAFITGLEAVLVRIAAALEAWQGGGAPETGIEGIREDLRALRDALDEMEVQDADRVMRKINARRWEKSLAETFQAMAQHIVLSDFDEAIGLIDGLLEP